MNAVERFEEIFQAPPCVRARAPGRVNLIGEHLDYNGGLVLPVAIGRAIEIAASPRSDHCFRLYATEFEDFYEGGLPSERIAEPFWANYLFGVAQEFAELGYVFRGMDAVIDGDIPRAAGLSSSAALEVSTAWAIREMLDAPLSRLDIALLCRRAENRFVGVQCGIMDQAISALGEAGYALLLDCGSLESRRIRLNLQGRAALLVAHSGVQRGLSQSVYNERRQQCEAALAVLQAQGGGIACLCDASLDALDAARHALDAAAFRRARHVLTETARVRDAVAALADGDFPRFGKILDASHASLRDDYEVSCPELDALTDYIRSRPGVFGSRLTGAGFGGCTVSVVSADAADALLEDLKTDFYPARTIKPIAFLTEAEAGVRLL